MLRFQWSLLTSVQRRAIVAAAAVAVALVLASGLELAATHGRIHPGVHVDGVDVGGLEPAAAAARVAPLAAKLANEPVIASADTHTFLVRPTSLGLMLDVKATVESAYRVGRRGLFPALAVRLRAWLGSVGVSPVIRYDRPKLSRKLAAIARVVDTPPRDGQVIDIDGRPAALPGQEGVALDQQVSRSVLLAALSDPVGRRARLPVTVAAPRIGTEAARSAAATLDIALSAPLRLTYRKHTWTVSEATIRKWMTITPRATSSEVGAPLTLVVEASPERVQATIASLTASIVKPAVDAKFAVDGASVRIVSSKTGLAVDGKAAFDLIARQLAQAGGVRVAALTLHSIPPKLTTEAARQMGVRERISSFTTQYSSGNPPRVNNIHLLASALNNTLVSPGDEFSFNKTIGPRTAAKGYQEAPVIVAGRLVPGLGGGICQVGTTMFNTVFFSGFPVTERTNHSFYISHYPDGRDATVSWDGPDFRFKNESNAWVLIKTSWSSDTITISLYGTSPGYQVTYTTGKWTNNTPFAIRQIADPALPKGTQIVEDVGVAGHDVTVVRTVRKNGKLVRRDEFSSHYRTKDETVRVGTKEPPKPKRPPKPKEPPSRPPTGTPDATGGAKH